jgi:Na+/H+ antiporter NhaA
MQTAWTRVATPLRDFVRTESGGASVLLAATVAALLWVNIDAESYSTFWGTELSIRIGSHGISDDLRIWLNEGLMAFFFYVIGLEARREFDIGELRDRRRLFLPIVAAIGGMALPIAIYLAFNAGESSAHGWGTAMSTDTAFALGVLALAGSSCSGRLRAAIVTVAVVDDLVALIVIATVYTDQLDIGPLLLGIAVFGIMVIGVRRRIRGGTKYFIGGVLCWLLVRESGIDPIIVGLAMGLLTWAAPAERGDLERASDLFRLFREQPTPALAREAQAGVATALAPNERLAQIWHPWSSYVIVPLFGLANAGIVLNGDLISRAVSSPITLGVVLGYVVGKPVGITGAAWLATKLSRGRIAPTVGWGALAAGGAAAGVGFTVALLIASRAFSGGDLDEAKIGVLAAGAIASAISLGAFEAMKRLPTATRARLLLGPAETIQDLAVAVDPDTDHIRGPLDAPVTLIEYGDFECPYCGRAEPIVRELLNEFGDDLRYVWRHLPLSDVHPHAKMAALAAEAADVQDSFWEMHDLLLGHQDALRYSDLVGYAEELGLDVDRFERDVHEHVGESQISADIDGADLSGVSGTPTFFVNGMRHQGEYDITILSNAVRAARARTLVAA